MTACIATEQVSTIITDQIFKVILKSGDTIMQSKGPKIEVTIQDRTLRSEVNNIAIQTSHNFKQLF